MFHVVVHSFQVNDGRGMNVPTQKQNSPFGDDFSSYNPSDITAINQSKSCKY